jgi:hypothetical protein
MSSPYIISPLLKVDRILPVVSNLSSDKSWRVRWSLGSRMNDICNSLGRELTVSSLLGTFENLLNDSEAEVLK